MVVLNLTTIRPTQKMLDAGLVNPPEEYGQEVRDLLTFDIIPSTDEVIQRVYGLVAIAAVFFKNRDEKKRYVMLEGPPWLVAYAHKTFLLCNYQPIYWFWNMEYLVEEGWVTLPHSTSIF